MWDKNSKFKGITMKISHENGFTLIELMSVISIIGILSTMALPSYQDRVIRKQMEEAFNLAEMAMDGVSDFYKKGETNPGGFAF